MSGMRSQNNRMRNRNPSQVFGLSPWKIKQQTLQSQEEQYQISQKIARKKHNTIEPKSCVRDQEKPNYIWKNKNRHQQNQRRQIESLKIRRYNQQKDEDEKIGTFTRYQQKECVNIKFRKLASPKHRRKLIKLEQEKHSKKQQLFHSPTNNPKNSNLQLGLGLFDCKYSGSHLESGLSTIPNSPKKCTRASNTRQTHTSNVFACNSPMVNEFNITTNGFSYVSQNKIIVMKDNKHHIVDRPPLQSVLKIRMFNSDENNASKMKGILENSEINKKENIYFKKSTKQSDHDELECIKTKQSKLLGRDGSKRFSGLQYQKQKEGQNRRNSAFSKSNIGKQYNYNYVNDENYEQSLFSQHVIVRTGRCVNAQNQAISEKIGKIRTVIRNGGRRMSVL